MIHWINIVGALACAAWSTSTVEWGSREFKYYGSEKYNDPAAVNGAQDQFLTLLFTYCITS